MPLTCTAAGIEAAAGWLINSNLDQHQLRAVRVAAKAAAVNALGQGNFTTAALLQPNVQDFFMKSPFRLKELMAYVQISEALALGASATPFATEAAAMAVAGPMAAAMQEKELQGALIMLRCRLVNAGH